MRSFSILHILVRTCSMLGVTILLIAPPQLVQGFVASNTFKLRTLVSNGLLVHTHNNVAAASSTIGSVTIVIPSDPSARSKYGSKSPVDHPTYTDAAKQLANKVFWFSDGTVTTTVLRANEINNYQDHLTTTDALIAMGLTAQDEGDDVLRMMQTIFLNRRRASDKQKCHFAIDCGAAISSLPSLVGPNDDAAPSPLTLIPWTTQATGKRLQQQMMELFDRWTSDDFAVALLLFFNQFIAPVPWVMHSIDATWEKGPIQNAQELYSMVSKCGDCITACLQDDTCKDCISALNAVDTRDQVISYRTIVSFESERLKDFSFCILTKNNIFNCHAEIPKLPQVKPIVSWRGETLTFQIAQSILVGHLDDEAAPTGALRTEISWKVAAGANVAYDQFPSQNQIFYPSANGRDMWYDPVFRVETIDGRVVWCKRHYKVRNGPVVGTFLLSVLDNGVTSSEFWTIAGVADDLSWIVFHYAGAAAAVGQRYIGGLVCTPDGTFPSHSEELWNALTSAGIQPWELFCVDNDPTRAMVAGPPPLTFYRDSVQKAKREKINEVVS